MSEKKTEDKLYSILNEMVKNHDSFFDKETAQYILNRLPTNILLENKYVYSNLENFSLETNFFGFILLKNQYDLDNNNLRINLWKELLKEKNEELLKSPQFILEPQNKPEHYPQLKETPKIKTNFATYYNLLHFDQYKSQKKTFFNEDLTQINKTVICLDFLSEKQANVFYFYNQEDYLTASITLINCIKEGKDFLIKNGWHNEQTFTKKLLSSKNIQRALSNLDTKDIEDLFSLDNLGIIIKEGHDYNSFKNNINLLNNLFPLATAEKWLEGFKKTSKKKDSTLNIVELFNNKFHKAYGLNIIDGWKGPGIRKESFRTTLTAAESFRDELDFFLPAIKNMKTEPSQIIQFFNSIMRSQDSGLFSIYLKHMDIPAYDIKCDKEYSEMINRLNKTNIIINNNVEHNSWNEFAVTIQADNLKNQLNSQQTTKRTLKI